jgi:subfamily B ATP-binding cassette protein MsbA
MKTKSSNDITLYKRLLFYVKPYWGLIVVSLLLALLVSGADGAIAWMVKPIMDDIFVNKNQELLKLIPVALLVLYFVKGLSRFGQSYLMRLVGQRVIMQLRNELYEHIQYMSLSFFHRVPSAVLMARITNDVNKLARISSQVIASFFRQIFTVIALLIVVFYREWRLASIYFLVLPVVVWPMKKVGQRLRKISRRDQEKLAELNTILQESFTGTKIVKAFGMEEYENQRFGRENRKLYKIKMKGVAADELLSPLMEFLGAIGLAIVIWYGGMQVIRGNTTPGTFFSFLAAVAMLYSPIRKLGKMHNVFQDSMAATERVFEVLDTPQEIADKESAIELPPFNRCVEFQGVYFSYDGQQPVLKDINLKVNQGQVVALVGLSGAGKSTLVDLIPRFYDVTAGSLRIDGVDVRDVKLASLRSQIGIVTQETILFNDTLAGNIAYGRQDATLEEIIQAAKSAYAHQFITEMPQGYDTMIGERGVKLSGGQRKRITIARAILKDPRILILDEATSELDSESERLVQQALEELMRGRTTLVIAHRLSTIIHADLIVVIDEGRIVQMGKHQELLEMGGVYQRLYELQFREQELKARMS